ncbi:hypothetical protein P875_00086663 [Aspergillus parasiticus SU-1]|uniref:Glycosyl transferase CAP10 domain-containing protein n=1 Tax=Aspergillus parasiticus (strain ATCC 56775 / NRRL 5862 / SRRC 143 / SU-1) TaxID=1403190 RepID=A0A0F0I239_ASPPU|nr:hypothetical protein P875_00086663 [Aspergillus parasiticus SU-1]
MILLPQLLKRRYIFLVVSGIVLLAIVNGFYLNLLPVPSVIRGSAETEGAQRPDFDEAAPHPIDGLIRDAQAKWDQLLSKRVDSLADATKQYRDRRGRHPPPGFDQWFAFAKQKKAVLIEDLFDQIYDDLSPYWGLDPQVIRRHATHWDPRIIVRNHTLSSVGHTGVNWLEVWMDMISTIQEFLPDMDIPLNGMDESRIIVPWETVSEYRAKDRDLQQQLDPKMAVNQYMTLSTEETSVEYSPPAFQGADKPFWDIMRGACPPESPGRTSNIQKVDFANPPAEFFNYRNSFSENGYVRDFERSKNPCWRAELQALHGSFIEPTSTSTTHELIPLFGGSKLTVNNEILIPPAVYWEDNPTYSGGKSNHGGPWSKKKDIVFWRGIASGGRNRVDTWTGYQRHRLVSMLNGTEVALTNGSSHGINFRLPDYEYYQVTAGLDGALPEFLNEHCDLGFLDLCCFPLEGSPHCSYTDPYFKLVQGKPMKEQYAFKYLPDVDGNSFSGRYRAFLLSTSLPIKATVYKEWHDSRLIPWAHFVPMDSLYMDVYGILQYFMGYKGRDRHDKQAEKIAMDGKSWAEKVLRQEDMQIYVYRLLLEYARLCDDQRDSLAFVEDLMNSY